MQKALARYLKAVEYSATDLFLVPVFAHRGSVWYEDGMFSRTDVPKEALRASGVRKDLWKGVLHRCGLDAFKHLEIRGFVTDYKGHQYFVASEIRVDGLQPPLSRALQLHVLYARGFDTVLPLCSWASVCGVNKDKSAETRKLPRTEKGAARLLRERFDALNEVLSGRRRSYWESSTLFSVKRRTKFGKRVLPFDRLRGLEVAESLGVEYVGDEQFPRLW